MPIIGAIPNRNSKNFNSYIKSIENHPVTEQDLINSDLFNFKLKEDYIMQEFYEIPTLKNYLVNKQGKVKSTKRGKNLVLKDCDRKGYRAVTLIIEGKRKTFSVHRLVAATFLKLDLNSDLIVDHINGNKSDNRLENLQILDNRANVSKGYKTKNTSSNYTGVYKNGNNWQAMIYIDDKNKNLGIYKTEKEASEKYKEALIKLAKNK